MVLVLVSKLLLAQYPDFTSPVDIPIVLSGNFGEIRSNHFHAGIDIRTKGETGLPVFSIEEGFVSRVAVSPTGYGYAIYIDHPSGYTSVYAHLDQFSPEVAAWVKTQQYKNKSFQVNLFPKKDQFIIKKGEEIGNSGNSGSSAGPHLHFEIRRTKSEKPINPLFFNFNISDETKPTVENLYVYPLGKNSHIMNKTERQQFKLVFYGGTYRLKGIQSLDLFGDIGFGVDAIDYLDNNWSKCGIYQLEYWVDNKLINSFELDELDYSKTRYLNSHIDYEIFQQSKQGVHKTFIEPGNKMEIYHQTYNGGLFNFDDGKRHKVQIIMYDVKMNSSEIQFYINSTTPVKHPEKKTTAKFKFYTDNAYNDDEIEVYLPVDALYNDLDFDYKKGNIPASAYSSLHRVHNKFTPLHLPIDIKIKPVKLPVELQDKALIAQFDIKTGKFSSIGGSFEKGWVKTTTRNFGDLCVVVDTIPPLIRPLSLKNNALTEPNRLRFRITDDLSGIKSYNGTLDGKWILFEYDAKRDLIVYNFDDRIKPGKSYKLKLIVEDQQGNIGNFETSFYY